MDSCIQYFGLNPGLNHSQASAFCPTVGGQLIVAENQAKFNFLTALYQTDFVTKGKNLAAWVNLAWILYLQFFDCFVIFIFIWR